MKVALTSIGTAAIVSIVACSGGPGTATDLRGGPDGIPKSSTDNPGGGNEPPGNGNQDPPGSASDNAGGSCLDCSGNYQCITSGSNDVSYVTLASVAGGCAVVAVGETDTSDASTLLCGGQFVITENGTASVIGQWSGGTGRFTVTATDQGQTLSVTCQLTNVVPPPQPNGTVTTGGNNGADAG